MNTHIKTITIKRRKNENKTLQLEAKGFCFVHLRQLKCACKVESYSHWMNYKEQEFMFGGKSAVLQNGAQTTICCSTSTTQSRWLFDLREKEAKTRIHVYISGAEVERINNFQLVRRAFTERLSRFPHASKLTTKAEERLYFLRKAQIPTPSSAARLQMSNRMCLDRAQKRGELAWKRTGPESRRLCTG